MKETKKEQPEVEGKLKPVMSQSPVKEHFLEH